MLTALSGRDFPSGRLMFQPDPEDVQGRVDVAIMRRTAVRTLPRPHSKRAHTFRAACWDGPASRTRLGTPSFVGLDKHSPVPSGLISEHVAERGPACVHDGFCHPGFRETSRVHVADDDQTILTSNLGGLLVEMVEPSIRDLSMDRGHAALASGALGDAEGCLVFPIVLKGRDLSPVTERGQFLQAKINSDRTICGTETVCDFAMECHVPASACILHERASLEFSFDLSRFPEAISALEVDRRIAVNLHGTRYEGNPTQRALRAGASPEARTFTVLVTGRHEPLNNDIGGIGVNAEVGRAASHKGAQFKVARPPTRSASFPPRLGFSLSCDTEIPDLIAGKRMASEVARARLQPVFEGQYRHPVSIAQRSANSKVAS